MNSTTRTEDVATASIAVEQNDTTAFIDVYPLDCNEETGCVNKKNNEESTTLSEDDLESCIEAASNHDDQEGDAGSSDDDGDYAAASNIGESNEEKDLLLQLRINDFYSARSARQLRLDCSVFLSTPPLFIFQNAVRLASLRADLEWTTLAERQRCEEEGNNNARLSWEEFDRTWRDKKRRIVPFLSIITLICTVVQLVEIGRDNATTFLQRVGSVSTPRIVEDDQWYRLVTAMFLHVSLFHWFCNMLALWIYGFWLERTHGSVKVGLLFMMAGIGGNLSSAVFLPHRELIGLSGGVFALIGMNLADIWTNWDLLAVSKSPKPWCGQWIVLFTLSLELAFHVYTGFEPRVDQFCHLGGLLFGFCFALPFIQHLRGSGLIGKVTLWHKWRVLLSRNLLFALALASFVAGIVVLWQNDGTEPMPCPQCKAIACVEFPFWSDDKWWECDNF